MGRRPGEALTQPNPTQPPPSAQKVRAEEALPPQRPSRTHAAGVGGLLRNTRTGGYRPTARGDRPTVVGSPATAGGDRPFLSVKPPTTPSAGGPPASGDPSPAVGGRPLFHRRLKTDARSRPPPPPPLPLCVPLRPVVSRASPPPPAPPPPPTLRPRAAQGALEERRIALYRFTSATMAYGRGYLDSWPEALLADMTQAERAVLEPPYSRRLDRRVVSGDGAAAVPAPRDPRKLALDESIFAAPYF